MKAEDWLSSVRRMEKQITFMLGKRQDIIDRLTSTTQNFDGDGAQSTKDPHKFDKLAEINFEIDELIDRTVERKAEIIKALELLDNKTERDALKYYYVELMPWSKVAEKLGRSERRIMTIKKAATQHLDRARQENTIS